LAIINAVKWQSSFSFYQIISTFEELYISSSWTSQFQFYISSSYCDGMRVCLYGTGLLMGPLSIPQMIHEWIRSNGGMITTGETKQLGEKPVPVPLSKYHFSYAIFKTQKRLSAWCSLTCVSYLIFLSIIIIYFGFFKFFSHLCFNHIFFSVFFKQWSLSYNKYYIQLLNKFIWCASEGTSSEI
jgi:hypothetical protein